ncbi:MAG: orange carotenoid protein N-terminal domain-containing protein [Elainellaceae cyanobacterium]
MSSTATNKLYDYLKESEQKIFQSFENLNTDDKLAWFYWVYEKMGDSITPAAPSAADPNLAPVLLGTFYKLSDDDQLAIMRQIVNQEDTEYSRYYGALSVNNRLMVWYGWARAMGETVVDLPSDYPKTDAISQLLDQTQQLEFQEQISVFRAIASDMGYSEVGSVPDQSQTGKTDSL